MLVQLEMGYQMKLVAPDKAANERVPFLERLEQRNTAVETRNYLP